MQTTSMTGIYVFNRADDTTQNEPPSIVHQDLLVNSLYADKRTALSQNPGIDVKHVGIIVNHHDTVLDHQVAPMGRVTTKRVPPSSIFSARISPPCPSTMRRAMASYSGKRNPQQMTTAGFKHIHLPLHSLTLQV